MSPKEASYGMGDPYAIYPTGADIFIPQELDDGRALDMVGISSTLESILARRDSAHLKAIKDGDYDNLLGASPRAVLTEYPQVAVVHWNILTVLHNAWTGLVAPSARLILGRVAERKYGANTWMPIPSGKFDPEKDVDSGTLEFTKLIDLIVSREGKEEMSKGGPNLRCGAFSDEETGFLVCSGCAPTSHYDRQPVHVDRREYTEVMLPTIPALVSMMRKKPEEFTDGVVLSLLQTTEYLAQRQSEAMAKGRYKIDLL